VSAAEPEELPPLFWWTNGTELFERAAHSSIASFAQAYTFNDFTARNPVTLENGLLELDPVANA